MTAMTLPAVTTGDSFTHFINEAFKYPVLEPEEEYMLAKRFHDHGDVEAAHTLVTSHLRLVVKIAFGYKRYGLPTADLVSEGCIGLMSAVKKFDPERGFRLATYAMWWIKAKINEFILNSWSMVRVGSVESRKKLFWSLRRVKAKLGLYEDTDLSDDQAREIGQSLGVSHNAVQDINRWFLSRDVSLNQPATIDGTSERVDLLVDDSPNQEEELGEAQEQAFLRRHLREALTRLDDRERHIIAARMLSETPVTLDELGAEFGVSRERVRQLEARALKKLRRHMAPLAEKAAIAFDA